MSRINRQITLAARPVGRPQESDFALVETPIPELEEGQFLIHTTYLSVDPYMRGRMNDRKSYAEPVKLGDVMVGEAVGKVVESKHPKFDVGDIVAGSIGWQEYCVTDGTDIRKVRTGNQPVSAALGVLGMPGLTAYFGLLEIADPAAGETVVVSGAAGAVGSTVGQIAKIRGCRVVGIAGTDEKVAYLTDELGFDAAFNYKTTKDYVAKLAELCPEGIDVYFDNVGGPITDAVFPLLNKHARVSVCGQISQYNATKLEQGPRLLWKLIEKQARVEGFLVFQFIDKFRTAMVDLAHWVEEGQLKYRENIEEGLENAPKIFLGLFDGENIGKQLVRVSPE
ncbi:Putative NADP-dependent oxidoreductase YfmJ [Symmachiella dynata]|uniref:NADP-dependent oxidoreductase YfmJ n=1 Tax=Symmachiella dynata TaxID=2527995 RepID=A0A517ZMI5_9PLAN|nr:NADP-dependent oxidoreductase [Symmachiella dynata]QDU43667.1 Putative NADP-dependent oxidoreductase YfmJ [Symmachiella dynata]